MVPAAIERGVAGPAPTASRAFRHSPLDIRLVAACALWAALGAAAIAAAQTAVVAAWVALCVWHVSNTVAHIQLHTPIFRRSRLNGALSAGLTALTGIPQSVWRARHLWHHAGEPPSGPRWPAGRDMAHDTAIVALTWGALAALDARVFLLGYMPGWLVGLGLCALHGRGEHVGERKGHRDADDHRRTPFTGTSCRDTGYNRLWFNDGYHAEHHREPGRHWTALPAAAAVGRESRWPPAVRGLADFVGGAGAAIALGWLERAALRSPRAQAWLIRTHRAAFADVLDGVPLRASPRVVIVGGGLFPRSYLALSELLPDARFELVDRDARHVAAAERFLAGCGGQAATSASARRPPTWRVVDVDGDVGLECDVAVVPLAFVGRRAAVYDGAMAPIVLVHDWLWRRRGERSAVVSMWLVKRVNAVVRP